MTKAQALRMSMFARQRSADVETAQLTSVCVRRTTLMSRQGTVGVSHCPEDISSHIVFGQYKPLRGPQSKGRIRPASIMDEAHSPLASLIARYSHGDEASAQSTEKTGRDIPYAKAYGKAEHQAAYERQACSSCSLGFLLVASHQYYLH